MNHPRILVNAAREAWLEARQKALNAEWEYRQAADEANLRYAEYAELENPGFSSFFRRVLNRQEQLKTNED